MSTAEEMRWIADNPPAQGAPASITRQAENNDGMETHTGGGMSLQGYRDFIAARAPAAKRGGFVKTNQYPRQAHQRAVVRFALDRGKSAAFLDTGLRKSFIELEFARQCAEKPANRL